MAASARTILEKIAKHHGSRIQEARDYDPNICSFAHNPKNRAELIAKSGQPLLRKITLEFKDLRVQLFANDYYLRVMIFGQLPEVFSLNRIDKIAGLRPAGITVISGRVYQLATQSGSDTSSKGILQTPAFAQMLDAITIGENESVHLYRNGIAAYFCLPDPARVELFMEGAVSFFNKLRLR